MNATNTNSQGQASHQKDACDPPGLSQTQASRIRGIDALADSKRKETVFLLHAVGLLDTTQPIPYDIGTPCFEWIMATGVLPKFVSIGGTIFRRTPRGGSQLTVAQWGELSAQEPLLATSVTDSEFEIIDRLVQNYVHKPRAEYTGPSEVLSTAEILDAVGVDVPSAGQRACADSLIRDLVGPPKLVRGEPRFHVNICDDGQWPDTDIVLMYPVPHADWTICSYWIDQSKPGHHVEALAGAGQKPLNVGALIY